MGELTADVRYDDKRNRLTCAFRMILVIPHLIVSYFWGIVAEVVAIPQWFIIVFTGKRNEALWELQWSWLSYAGRVTSYHYLMFDEYPAFGTDQRKVPMVQDLGYAEPASRLTNGLRFIWIIPAIVLLIIFGIAMSFVLLIAWFAILFTGKFPMGMFDFMMKGVRFTLQVTAYGLMMTDTYPKWGSGVPAVGASPGSAPISPPASGIVPPAPAT